MARWLGSAQSWCHCLLVVCLLRYTSTEKAKAIVSRRIDDPVYARVAEERSIRGSRGTRSKFLVETLEAYDNRISPNFDSGESLLVNTSIYILSLDSISEIGMDYWLSIYLRQSWVDERLSYRGKFNDSQLTLDARVVDRLWVPDLFFPNEKNGYFHKVSVPNRLVRLTSNGGVFYSARITVKLSCPMALQNFPLDTQICEMKIESYGHTKDQLDFRWITDKPPVEVDEDLTLPEYKLQKTEHQYCEKIYSTGEFPCMKLRFHLKRDMGFYMIQTYIPSFLIVVLSWVSFWISVDAVPARISLGVLTILTMTTQSAGIRQTLPRVSYIKAIDVWMSVCLFFVFAALLEFAIVNVFSRKEVKRPVVDGKVQNTHVLQEMIQGVDDDKKAKQFVRDPKGKEKARKVDKISRKLFPGIFIAFNVVYWIGYIVSSHYDFNSK